LSLSLICFGPSAVLVGKVKSGALFPTASGMDESSSLSLNAGFNYKIDDYAVKGRTRMVKR